MAEESQARSCLCCCHGHPCYYTIVVPVPVTGGLRSEWTPGIFSSERKHIDNNGSIVNRLLGRAAAAAEGDANAGGPALLQSCDVVVIC